MRDRQTRPDPHDPKRNYMRFCLSSSDERDEYRKVIAFPPRATHRQEIVWVADLDFEIREVPLTLGEIAGKTDSFAKLTDVELAWLCSRHGLEITADERRQAERRQEMVAKLLAHKPAEPEEKPEAEAEKPQLVVPDDLKTWNDGVIESYAVEHSLKGRYPNWKKMSPETKRVAIARHMAEGKEPVTT